MKNPLLSCLRLLLVAMFLLSAQAAWCQLGKIKGNLVVYETPVEFAVVKLYKQNVIVTGLLTDEQGKFEFGFLEPGVYKLVANYEGIDITEEVTVHPGEYVQHNIVRKTINRPYQAREIIITEAHDIDRREIREIMGDRNPYSLLAATQGGVTQRDLGDMLGLRGARATSTAVYVDGVRLRGELQLPFAAINWVDLHVGGMPAEFGDASGGVIDISTIPPKRSVVVEYYDPDHIILF